MQEFRPYGVSWGQVATVLRTHAARGVRAVHLTGGEPTIHPRFVDVLRLAKRLKMRTSVGTIGTMLSRREFAADALPFLDEGLFSLHGPSAHVHDAMTRRDGSFRQVVDALTLARELRPDFGAFVNTVITNTNIEFLGETVELADQLGASLIIVSNLTPEGLGLDNYRQLAVPLSRLGAILPTIPAHASNAIVRFFGVPMCLLGEHRMLSNDLHWDPRVTVEWQNAPGKVVFDGLYNWAPDRKRVHATECADCSMNTVCMGVFDRYRDLFPTTALTPDRSKGGNV